jgi:transcriptional regulator with XRE-family HTH domain
VTKKPLQEVETLPARIQYAMDRIGFTAATLSERSGIHPSQISRLRDGTRASNVALPSIIKLARALDVPVGWLAANEGPLPAAPTFRQSTDRRRRDKPDGD